MYVASDPLIFLQSQYKRSATISCLLEQRVMSVSCQFPDLWQSWRCDDRSRQKTTNLSRYAVEHTPRRPAWIPAGVAAQSLGDLTDVHLVLPRTLRDNRHRAPVTWCELEMNFCRVWFQLLRSLLVLVLRVFFLLWFVLRLLVRAHGSGWSPRDHLRSSRDHEFASDAATVHEHSSS